MALIVDITNVIIKEPKTGSIHPDNIGYETIKDIVEGFAKDKRYKQELKNPIKSTQLSNFTGIRCCTTIYDDDCYQKTLPNSVKYVYSFTPNTALSAVVDHVKGRAPKPAGVQYYSGATKEGVPYLGGELPQDFKINPDYYAFDGLIHVVVDYVCYPCKLYDHTCAGYSADIHCYMYLNTTEKFYTRCCTGIDIDDSNMYLCPREYATKGAQCKGLMDKYCTGNISDPICGCYPDYVNNFLKDKTVAKKIRDSGVEIPVGCSTTCSPAKAWVTPEGSLCEMQLCNIDLSGQGVIKTSGPGVNIKYYCEPEPEPEPEPKPQPPPKPSGDDKPQPPPKPSGDDKPQPSGDDKPQPSGGDEPKPSGGDKSKSGDDEKSKSKGEDKPEQKVSTTTIAIVVSVSVALMLLLLLLVFFLS